MIRRTPRARSGITLTEILISILILGVGMVSLATLFPIGLLRLRDAQRNNRSVLLARYAIGEINGRDLFNNQLWFQPIYNPTGGGFDPWVADPYPAGGIAITTPPHQLETPTPGLPVAYDPLWYQLSGVAVTTTPARFGQASAADPLRPDPGGTNLPASAAGLQRITGFTSLNDLSIFASQDDYAFQAENGAADIDQSIPGAQTFRTGASPLIPAVQKDPTTGNPVTVHDFSYTWAFTGYRAEAGEYSRYVGSIVLFNNRSFGFVNGSPTGERVVEGIFGYGQLTARPVNSRLVMLRWNLGQPDPGVAVGGWIADVTYEQNQANSNTKTGNVPSPGPMQRCNWYRVVKRGAAAPDPNNSAFMQMLVTVSTPVSVVTLQTQTGTNPPVPTFTNAALVIPSVVNVFPWSFYTRN